ncbi:hypothetical protein F2P81_007481 [Scophthalmus maximus]|uniref:Uncharacterized protein n=1 Tax=Scophthalmus maximus TaxID=52904 RepID=A0A6A4SVI3_SCOMX|nr:hypothetical protein F2P81_007481 [Scophthalmus maximus]
MQVWFVGRKLCSVLADVCGALALGLDLQFRYSVWNLYTMVSHALSGNDSSTNSKPNSSGMKQILRYKKRRKKKKLELKTESSGLYGRSDKLQQRVISLAQVTRELASQ